MGEGGFSTFRHLSRLPTPLRRVKCQLREKRHDRLCCDLHHVSILRDPGSVVLTVVLFLSAHITLDLYRAHSGDAESGLFPDLSKAVETVALPTFHKEVNVARLGMKMNRVMTVLSAAESRARRARRSCPSVA